jgi:hypothetical protein
VEFLAEQQVHTHTRTPTHTHTHKHTHTHTHTQVRIVASMPCYSVKNVDTQRGKGVFERSIAGEERFRTLCSY